MPDRPWRIDVEPVHAAGSPDSATSAPTDAPTSTERIASSRRRATDPLIAGILVVGLLAAVLKPWGVSLPTVPPRVAEVAPSPQTTPTETLPPLEPPILPDQVFAPRARSCMRDVGWLVCVLGAAGDADQAVKNQFALDAPPLVDPGGTPAFADPLLVMATLSGATIAFYPPDGFYIPDGQTLPSPTPLPGGGTVIARGPLIVTAWHVHDTAGSRTLDLRSTGPVIEGGRVAGNVVVPASEELSALEAWPRARYIVWLFGIGSRQWQEFFDFQVVGLGTTATP